MTTLEYDVVPDPSLLAVNIAHRLEARIGELQAAGLTPRVLLTGGTIAMAAYRQLGADAVDWSDVEFWFGDERYVPAGLPDRNDGQARAAFLDRVGATRVNTVADNDCSMSAADAAAAYASTLPTDLFDVALFGVGPDGHIASLFPGFDQLDETATDAVAVFDAPKPPPVRISLTLPRLNRSRAVWFLVSGPDKADAVAQATVADGDVHQTPARGVCGVDETLWLLDEAAARNVRK